MRYRSQTENYCFFFLHIYFYWNFFIILGKTIKQNNKKRKECFRTRKSIRIALCKPAQIKCVSRQGKARQDLCVDICQFAYFIRQNIMSPLEWHKALLTYSKHGLHITGCIEASGSQIFLLLQSPPKEQAKVPGLFTRPVMYCSYGESPVVLLFINIKWPIQVAHFNYQPAIILPEFLYRADQTSCLTTFR